MTTFNTRVTFDHVRNTAAGFTAANPVLGYGVTGLETDTGRSKVGDGVAAWAALPYLSGAAHQHPIGDVTGLQAALDSKATPAQVTAAVAAVVDAAPGTLDTLNELAAALGDDANFASTVTNALAAKAPLASPTFTGNVSGITKAMVGLGNVDNTADSAKPVSTAQAAADAAVASAAAADATSKANAAQAAAVQRSNHTGTQAISTVDGLQTALDGKASTTDARLTDAREWSAATVTQAEAEAGTSTSRLAFSPLRVFQAVAAWWAASSAKAKLDGIATGATANATDAQLRDRATHTGFQTASTISDFSTAVVAAAPPTTDASLLTSGTLADARLTANVVLTTDSRLSNARTPTSHASTHQTGGADAINPVIVSPSSLSASQNDYAPGVCDIIRLSSSTAIDLTGLVAGTVDGAMRLVINTNASGGAAITLRHESASSTAANRFRNTTGGDFILPADGGSAVLTYSSAISRWRIL